MNRLNSTIMVLLCTALFFPGSYADKTTGPKELKGPYLGQKPPGVVPQLFAPGVVSTPADEINAVFSPAGNEFYFSRDTGKNTSKAGKSYTIMFMTKIGDIWTTPKTASFAKKYMNADMCISYDGKRLFFCSDRPLTSNTEPRNDADIWMVERKGKDWSVPRNLGPVVNSDQSEWYPSVTKDGTLYFSSYRKGGKGKGDIYRSRLRNGVYLEPENLGAPVNTSVSEGDVFIAPDESYLIISRIYGPGGLGVGDLVISFRKADGTWSTPVNPGKPLNSTAHEYCPMVSPDGKYLFFSSTRAGTDDVYWVDTRIIESLEL